jgi:hypothetical protein
VQPAWIFRPDPLNNSKLDFVSLQQNKLIANRIACASVGVVGDVKCDTIEATTGGYIPALDVDLLYVSDTMSLNGKRITQVGAPESNTDVVNKIYVDQSIQNAIDDISIPPSLNWRFPPIGALRWTAGFTDFVLRIEGDNPNLVSDPEVRIILPSADSAVQLDYTYETWPHMMVGIEIDWEIRRRGTILPVVKQGTLVLGRNVANGLQFETDYDVTFIVYPTNPKGRGQTTVPSSYFTYTLLGVEF